MSQQPKESQCWGGDVPNPEVYSEILDQIQVRARKAMINQSQNLDGQCLSEPRGKQPLPRPFRQNQLCVGLKGQELR